MLEPAIPAWAMRTKADDRAVTEGCYWNQQRASKATNFISKFFHTQFSKNFKLTTEQFQLIQQLYGFRLPNGNRRFRFANIHVPKKSFGKTMLTAAICYYELCSGEESSPFICSSAASRENAAQIFDEVRYALERSPFENFANVKRHTKEIEIVGLNSRYRSLASDGKRVHGFNCSLCVLDECHVIPAELWRSLRYSTAARPNGLLICISTSGEDLSHWYTSVYQKSKRVLEGTDTDITHFALVHEMEEDGNPEDPKQWKLANPLLGSPWCDADQFARDLESAKLSGLGEWLTFLRLRLNKWVQVDEHAYFDVSKFDEYQAEPTEDELKKCAACIGVDASEVGDPSSVCITWDLGNGKFHTRTKAWVCKAAVDKRRSSNMRLYGDFENMVVTDGDMLDEREILNYLIELHSKYNIVVANFDPRSAYVMANRFSEHGVKCERIPATARYFNPAMCELHKAITEGRLTHEGDEWLKFCLQNIRVEINRFEEVYPVRKKCKDKIDGGYALLLSFFGLIANQQGNANQGIVIV